MVALLSLILFGAIWDVRLIATVNVREWASPERVVPVNGSGSQCVDDAIKALKLPADDLDRMDMWLVRPGPSGTVQVLMVDWNAIAKQGVCNTNYKIFPGDQLYLQARRAR